MAGKFLGLLVVCSVYLVLWHALYASRVGRKRINPRFAAR